jgi:hypothetical protein
MSGLGERITDEEGRFLTGVRDDFYVMYRSRLLLLHNDGCSAIPAVTYRTMVAQRAERHGLITRGTASRLVVEGRSVLADSLVLTDKGARALNFWIAQQEEEY